MKRFIYLCMIGMIALAACSPIIDKQADPVTAIQQTPTQAIETQTPLVEVSQPTAMDNSHPGSYQHT